MTTVGVLIVASVVGRWLFLGMAVLLRRVQHDFHRDLEDAIKHLMTPDECDPQASSGPRTGVEAPPASAPPPVPTTSVGAGDPRSLASTGLHRVHVDG